MSSRYDKLPGQQPVGDEPTGVVFDGAFSCHGCDETVDEATWYERQKLLVWKCSQGHVSQIDEFTL